MFLIQTDDDRAIDAEKIDYLRISLGKILLKVEGEYVDIADKYQHSCIHQIQAINDNPTFNIENEFKKQQQN